MWVILVTCRARGSHVKTRIASAGIASMALIAVVALAVAFATSGGPLELEETDDGTTVRLAPGEAFKITLESNPSTGYTWQVADIDEAVVEQEGAPVYVTGSGDDAVGAGGTETFLFRAGEPGECTLGLEYRRPWELLAPEREFSVTVVVE